MNCVILVCKIVLGIYQGQIIMKKSLLMIPCFGLLAACGGSDGGGSDETDPPYGFCSNGQSLTCTYSVSELELTYTMYVEHDDGLYFRGDFYSQYKPPVYPYEMTVSDIERLEILQDGVLHKRDDSTSITFSNLDTSGSNYEFYWYRNNELVGYSSVDRLPEPTKNFTYEVFNNTSLVTAQWDAVPDHKYSFEMAFLNCTYPDGERNISFDASVPNYSISQPESSFTIDVETQFGEKISELMSSYQSCYIAGRIIGDSQTMIPTQHVGNIKLNFAANDSVFMNLF